MPAINVEKIRERRKKLQAELRQLKAREQQATEQRAIVAGRAVLEHAESDPAFRQQLDTILGQRLKKAGERKLFDLHKPASSA